MNILDAINNAPNDWMVDLRTKTRNVVKSFPVGDLKAVLISGNCTCGDKPSDQPHFMDCPAVRHGHGFEKLIVRG
jgi:hypothetical protein